MGRISLRGTLPYEPVSKSARRHATEPYLASRLVETEVMSELLLADGAWRVDLVAEDEEGHLGELLNREKRVELRLGLGEPLNVDAVYEENDAVDLGEVVPPEAARWRTSVSVGWITRAQAGNAHLADVLRGRRS